MQWASLLMWGYVICIKQDAAKCRHSRSVQSSLDASLSSQALAFADQWKESAWMRNGVLRFD
jgi:hypothetical protein